MREHESFTSQCFLSHIFVFQEFHFIHEISRLTAKMKTRKKILKKSRRRGNLIIEIANFDF